jgi:riboflavin synthase
MISKGSIAVDGVSLTLVNVQKEHFTVQLIPHTLANTTLDMLSPGGLVNIETDILAKYAQKAFQGEI